MPVCRESNVVSSSWPALLGRYFIGFSFVPLESLWQLATEFMKLQQVLLLIKGYLRTILQAGITVEQELKQFVLINRYRESSII